MPTAHAICPPSHLECSLQIAPCASPHKKRERERWRIYPKLQNTAFVPRLNCILCGLLRPRRISCFSWVKGEKRKLFREKNYYEPYSTTSISNCNTATTIKSQNKCSLLLISYYKSIYFVNRLFDFHK